VTGRFSRCLAAAMPCDPLENELLRGGHDAIGHSAWSFGAVCRHQSGCVGRDIAPLLRRDDAVEVHFASSGSQDVAAARQ